MSRAALGRPSDFRSQRAAGRIIAFDTMGAREPRAVIVGYKGVRHSDEQLFALPVMVAAQAASKGSIRQKTGTFVLQGLGQFDGKEARTRLEVVLGPGTGDLAGLRGAGEAVTQNGATGTFRLDYEL